MPKPRRPSPRRQYQRLANPGSPVAMDAAMAEGEARFGPRIRAVFAEIQALLAGRRVRALLEAETAQLMALRAERDSLSIQHKHFVEAALAFQKLREPEGACCWEAGRKLGGD